MLGYSCFVDIHVVNVFPIGSKTTYTIRVLKGICLELFIHKQTRLLKYVCKIKILTEDHFAQFSHHKYPLNDDYFNPSIRAILQYNIYFLFITANEYYQAFCFYLYLTS